jgi:hypothetical protein
MRRILPYVANVVNTTDLIFQLFIIFQKQMRWWAIIFREAHGALLACPRFQSNKRKTKINKKRGATEKSTLYALMRDDGSERIRPLPYDKEYAYRRSGEKENEWE